MNICLPHSCSVFQKSIVDIVKQPTNFINKAKRDIKKNFNDLEKEHPAFSEFHLEKPGSFVGYSCQTLGITKNTLVHFQKYANAFVFNNAWFFARHV